MTAFLAMGGYAWYVWMAYGAVAVAIIAEVIALRHRSRRAFETARIAQHAGRRDGRRPRTLQDERAR